MLITNTQTIANLFNTNCLDVDFSGVSIDSRDCKNKLFIAIIGNKFNAHNFINEAQKNGAAAIVASEKISSMLPVIYVRDTTIALGEIAKFHRNNMPAKVVAITGSNGKTTTKNMLANILSLQAPTLKTSGNLNNHFGVPLTLLNLGAKHRFAIIEMGANHLGEIAYLRKIAVPDVAVVINTLDAHIGEFGGFDNLVKTKGEIYAAGSQNIANTQSSFTANISFGKGGNIFADNINNNSFDLNIFDKKITVALQLLGQHNIENALAASSCAHALGFEIHTIWQGLENTKAEKGRLSIIKTDCFNIIDDSYNASPTSSKYALEILAKFKGRTIAILAEMAELGNNSDEIHAEIGRYARTLGITHLYSIGENAKNYNFKHFENRQDLLEKIKTFNQATLLFKGSRVAKLEQIIAKLCV